MSPWPSAVSDFLIPSVVVPGSFQPSRASGTGFGSPAGRIHPRTVRRLATCEGERRSTSQRSGIAGKLVSDVVEPSEPVTTFEVPLVSASGSAQWRYAPLGRVASSGLNGAGSRV